MSTAGIKISSEVNNALFSVDYDASDVIKECGGNVTSFSSRVSGKFNNSLTDVQLESSTSQIGRFNLKTNNCPVTLDIQATVIVDGAQKNVSFSRQIPCQTADIVESSVVRDFGVNTDISSQSGVNEAMIAQINSLQSNIQSLLNSTVNGQSVTTTLNSQQTIIDSQADTISDLQNLISQMMSRIDQLERTI
jgi:hypothetical protein